MQVKINNKNYPVPELTFKHFSKMEEQGFSVVDAFRKEQALLIAMGFVCVVTGLERDDAENLIEQHVLGGGNIIDIVEAFTKAASESGFFKRMLGIKTEEKTKKKAGNSEVATEVDPDEE
jgi:hypothetical protein